MLDAIRMVEDWPVPTAAAGAVDPHGAVSTVGDPDHRFPLASVTKLLTAMAVLVAAEEGTVHLDEPVANPDGATVADLLCHASGLAVDDDRPVAPPRRRRIYSNRGYELAGDLVASRAAMPFAAYLRESVLEPLSMSATSLDVSPAHGATSTVRDLLRFAADLRSSRLVSEGTRRSMAEPRYPDLDGVLPGFGVQRPNPWGLGPEVRAAKHPHWTGAANSPATYGHFGQSGTFLWVDPAAEVTLVVLTDRAFGAWAATRWPALSDAVLAAVPHRSSTVP